MILARTAPSWVMPKAYFDFDFANNRYYGCGPLWGGTNNNKTGLWPGPGSFVTSGNNSNLFYTPDTDGIWKRPTTAGSPYFFRRTRYGLWSEGYGVDANFCLQCRDWTQAGSWTATTITPTTTNVVGADATIGQATQLTAGASPCHILQIVGSLTSGVYTFSCLAKRISGTGTVSITVDGISYTDVTAKLTTTGFTQISLITGTITSATVGIQLGTNGDVIVVDFAQLENNNVATSPILTTAASVTRGIEGYYFNTTGTAFNAGQRFRDYVFWSQPAAMLAQYSGNFDANVAHNIVGDDASHFFIQGAAGGGAVSILGNGGGGGNTITTSNSETYGIFNLNKVCARLDGSGGALCLNGGPIAKQNPPTYTSASYGSTHGQILNNGAGHLPAHGYMKRLTAWCTTLPSDGQMQQWTTVTEPY